MTMADHMAADGYAKAGYKYIIIDDCWLAKNRTVDGKLQPDPARFPSGIKALADYVSAPGIQNFNSNSILISNLISITSKREIFLHQNSTFLGGKAVHTTEVSQPKTRMMMRMFLFLYVTGF